MLFSKTSFLRIRVDLSFPCLKSLFTTPLLTRQWKHSSKELFIFLQHLISPGSSVTSLLTVLQISETLKHFVSCHMQLFFFVFVFSGTSFLIYMPGKVLIRLQTNPQYYICEASWNYPYKIWIFSVPYSEVQFSGRQYNSNLKK